MISMSREMDVLVDVPMCGPLPGLAPFAYFLNPPATSFTAVKFMTFFVALRNVFFRKEFPDPKQKKAENPW